MAKRSKTAKLRRELDRAGALCLAFANLAAVGRDDRRRDPQVRLSGPIASYGGLLDWSRRMAALEPATAERLENAAAERPEEAAQVQVRGVRLSTAVLGIFTAVAAGENARAEDLQVLNQNLRRRQIISGENGYRRGWAADEEALDRVLWPLAHSAADLLVSERSRKVRQCATPGCSRLFVYASSLRRWCDANTCGNRARGKDYRKMVRRLKQESKKRSGAEVMASLDENRERREKTQAALDEDNERLRRLLREARES